MSDDARFARAIGALVLVVAACAAAVIAHVVIDMLGDVLLARDAYDNVAHSSRTLATLAAVAAGGLAAWRLVALALAEARGRTNALRAALEAIASASPAPFILGVTGATIAVLALMGGLDALLDGSGIIGPADVLGGSLPLGVSVAATTGVLVALLARVSLRRLTASHRAIVAAFVAIVARFIGADRPRLVCAVAGLRRAPRRPVCGAPKRFGKRAPPVPAA